MGILLVGGFFAVAGIAVVKFSGHSSGKPRASSSAFAPCDAQAVTLPQGYQVEDMVAEADGSVTLLVSQDEVMRVLRIDSCSGETISDLTVKQGAGTELKRTRISYPF